MVNASALLFTLMSATTSVQDPTRPLTPLSQPAGGEQQTQPAQAEPRLQAIFSGAGQPSAMLDGELYVAGDTVGRYRLRRIAGDRVELEGPEAVLILTLFPSLDKSDTQ